MANATLFLSKELESAFAEAQTGRIRAIKVLIDEESFVLAGTLSASNQVDRDFEALKQASSSTAHGDCSLQANQACFLLFCGHVDAPALRWVLCAFVPEASASVSVRDKMLFSSSRDCLKKHLGLNYFVGEFHATDLQEITLEAFENARRKQTADAPLSETELLLKEASTLERDTNVKSTAMSVLPFEISQNVHDKLRLFQNNKFDWIAMKLNAESESVDVVKSLEKVEWNELPHLIDTKAPSFVAFRYRGPLTTSPFTNAPVRLKMANSTCKATILAIAKRDGVQFNKTVELNDPATALDDLQNELASEQDGDDLSRVGDAAGGGLKAKEFARPSAPGRGRGPRRPPRGR